MEGRRRRWPWQGWRILGGAPVPPDRRSLRASDGVDEAAIGTTDPAETAGGPDIARDYGRLGDPLEGDRGRQG
jgi:hypothetical protein